jgi:hypothetical protein
VPAAATELSPADPHPDPLAQLTARELLDGLEAEIGRLPETYRLPIIFCCLEGLSQEEAARRLGWTAGSVKGRLERGRARLHARLTRRGLTLSAALAAVEVSRGGAPAAVCLPATAVRTAMLFAAGRAAPAGSAPAEAAALAEGVLTDMAVKKLVLTAAVVLAVGVTAAAGGLAYRSLGARPDARPQQQARSAAHGAVGQVPSGGSARPRAAGDDVPASLTTPNMRRWKRATEEDIAQDPALKALAAKYPVVLLHSRRYAGGRYGQSAYSFNYGTADEAKHYNDVQLLFGNGGAQSTFNFNLAGGQQNLVVDLGKADFEKDPDPSKISIDQPGVDSASAKAVPGHVYLERVRDDRGNNFYVLFQVVAVDPDSRYVAFLWRRLPGGKMVKRPQAAGTR